MTAKDAAEYFKVNTSTIYRWGKSGKLKTEPGCGSKLFEVKMENDLLNMTLESDVVKDLPEVRFPHLPNAASKLKEPVELAFPNVSSDIHNSIAFEAMRVQVLAKQDRYFRQQMFNNPFPKVDSVVDGTAHIRKRIDISEITAERPNLSLLAGSSREDLESNLKNSLQSSKDIIKDFEIWCALIMKQCNDKGIRIVSKPEPDGELALVFTAAGILSIITTIIAAL